MRIYTGTEDDDDAWEGRETRLRLGAHHEEGAGRPWPIWALSSRDQRDWLEAHDEDGHDYSEDAEPEVDE